MPVLVRGQGEPRNAPLGSKTSICRRCATLTVPVRRNRGAKRAVTRIQRPRTSPRMLSWINTFRPLSMENDNTICLTLELAKAMCKTVRIRLAGTGPPSVPAGKVITDDLGFFFLPPPDVINASLALRLDIADAALLTMSGRLAGAMMPLSCP